MKEIFRGPPGKAVVLSVVLGEEAVPGLKGTTKVELRIADGTEYPAEPPVVILRNSALSEGERLAFSKKGGCPSEPTLRLGEVMM